MPSDRTVIGILVVVAVVAAVALVGTASAGHGAEFGNYTVNLPHPSDHYPRGVNGHNASINHFAAGTQELYDNTGAPQGIEELGWIVIQNQDVDFSRCSSTNTAAYGIDRGNNRPGTETDVDLLRYMEASYFNDHSIKVDHYEGDELAAPGDAPVHLDPEDEIVAHQGYQSQGGACYGMPEEPGWYQIEGFANGTAYNGNHVKIELTSHYFYICECDSEQEARNMIGPPPSEQGDDPTPTPTPAPDSNDGDDPTPTPEPDPGADPTPTPESEQNSNTPTKAPDEDRDGQSNDGPSSNDGDDDGGQQQQRRTATQGTEAIPVTPTIAHGPGFGAGLALLTLLAAALVAVRRR